MSGNQEMKRGHHLVDPGLTTHGLFSSPDDALRLSEDDCVRCLSYILGRMGEIAPVPQNIHFEIIPVSYHHFGPPYACIGMYTEGCVGESKDLTLLSMELGEKVEAYIKKVGLRRLVTLSFEETLQWQDVLRSESDAEPPVA